MGVVMRAHEVESRTYCLMPNHIDLIAVPQSADGLRRAIVEVHRRYTRMVNFGEGWRRNLWQGWFASFMLDEPYLLTAARDVDLNPVRAGLANSPSRQQWSSAAAHARKMTRWCELVISSSEPPNCRGLLARVTCEEDIKVLR